LTFKLTDSFFVASSRLINIATQKQVDLVNNGKIRQCNLLKETRDFEELEKHTLVGSLPVIER